MTKIRLREKDTAFISSEGRASSRGLRIASKGSGNRELGLVEKTGLDEE